MMLQILAILLAMVVPASNLLVTTAQCGTTKGCLSNPPNCKAPNCNSIVTWKKSDINGFVDFGMMAKSDGWVALALSDDTLMGKDNVVHCVINSSAGNEIYVGYSYNELTPYKTNKILTNSEISVKLLNVSSTYVDGHIHCRFSRSVSEAGDKIFALNKNYYLFLSYGPTDNIGRIVKHRDRPLISPKKADITKNVDWLNSDGGSDKPSSFSDSNGNEVTYKTSRDGNSIEFSIKRTSNENSQWISVGFSNDQTMADDSVIDCIRKADGNIVIQSSYNDYHANRVLSPPTIGISMQSGSYTDGVLQCDVVRPATGVGSPEIFEFNKDYYLLLANGPVSASGTKQYHSRSSFSSSKINLRSGGGQVKSEGGSSGDRNTKIKRAHGILMITAWVLIVSTSILIARYYKSAWPGKKLPPGKKDVWFALHRFLMLLGMCCTIVGFVIIFVVNEGKLSSYPSTSPTYFWAHAPLGIAVMSLVIINPLMAAFRCKPDAKFRSVFNWLHWFVGTCAHLAATVTVFFGVKIGEVLQPKLCHSIILWLLVAFVVFHAVIEIILSIQRCISDAVSTRDGANNRNLQVGYEMSKPGEEEVPRVAESNSIGWSLIFQYFILVLYFIIVLGLWMTIVVFIGLGKTD